MARVIDPSLIKIARSVRSYASAGAKISSAESRHPVLIFSPGNEANVATYAALIEELSSHGYMVLGIGYPYEAVAVLYPDGRIARFNSEDNRSKQGTPNLLEMFGRFYRERVEWRAGDASFALTQLEKLNAGNSASPFSNRLDLSRVGGIGHSIGAVAAAQMCQTDRRFKLLLANSAPSRRQSASRASTAFIRLGMAKRQRPAVLSAFYRHPNRVALSRPRAFFILTTRTRSGLQPFSQAM